MKASFIIGFHTARMDNLVQTLEFLWKQHGEILPECELVTICQDECDLDRLGGGWGYHKHFNMNAECMQLPIITNFGVNEATCDKIIILESDRILPTGYFASVIDQLEEGVQITCKNMRKLTEPATDDQIESEEYKFKEEHRSESNDIGMRNAWSGNTALMKSDFEKAGRMDESYLGYGWADSDMTYAMESVGVKTIFRDEIELHLWHPSATYGEGDQKQMFINNGLHFCGKWKQDIPNWFRDEIRDHKRNSNLWLV